MRDQSGDLRLLTGLEEFREHLGGALTITLLRDIGVSVEVHTMDLEHIQQSILELTAGLATA